MKRLFFVWALLFTAISVSAVGAQNAASSLRQDSPEALARAAFEAHGGSKLREIRTLVIRGSVDVTASTFQQAIAGGFSTIISGDKYILDIQTPFQSIKQIYDGRNTVSSIPGIILPPVTSLGFPMLRRLGEDGVRVGPLPEGKKRQKGFRLTAPDGFYTDFIIDEKTSLIKSFESAYEIGGRTLTTSAVVDRNRVVDGIAIPEKYSQRFDLGQFVAYSDFKAKEILINPKIDESVFLSSR
ncbi:MAG: hypothetical protein C4325_11775 [Blastocatellia bacterium]